MTDIRALPTPFAVVDRAVVDANTHRMSERVASLGARLRPHVKTHKCLPAARLSVRGHFGGITVSTMAEAHHFADGGFADIVYAVPLSLGRVGEAIDAASRIERFAVLVDHERAVAALGEAANAQRKAVDVLLKVDCGYHRAGVDPEGGEGPRLAKSIVASERLRFRGVLAHAGHSYACRNASEVRRVAAQERDVTVAFARRLRATGIPVDEVSIGSTPTAVHVDGLEGVTELRPGNYVFFDAFQASIGSCEPADAALSVIGSVIGAYPERNQLVLDVGALALSKDPGALHVDPDAGFGVLCTLDGQSLSPGLRLSSLSQEHGIVTGARAELSRFDVGDRLRVVANHSCLTAAQHPCYHVVDSAGSGGLEEIVDTWVPTRGW